MRAIASSGLAPPTLPGDPGRSDARRRAHALDLVGLTGVMELTRGRPEIVIGLLDGPVAGGHPALAGANIRGLPGPSGGTCAHPASAACVHGTFVAGMLSARRGSAAPAICPDCTLLLHPIFAEAPAGAAAGERLPSATPRQLAAAITACVDAGARILNLSAGYGQPSVNGAADVEGALDYAARRGVLAVVAAGNQGALGGSAITRHPWVIPVAACDLRGRPLGQSNLGASVGRRGLRAPGDAVTSLGPAGDARTAGGTSVAAPFVTGALALLWSLFPAASAADVRAAVVQGPPRRATVVPPLLDAWSAYQALRTDRSRSTAP